MGVDDPEGLLADLRMSATGRALRAEVAAFVTERAAPGSEEFHRLGADRTDRWSLAPGQLEVLERLKGEARDRGLWNLFLPRVAAAAGITTLDFAHISTELGRVPLAAECLNCSPPDSGNMEVLDRVGTAEQKRRWLEPLLAGEIRSAFAMTEPEVASSDPRNLVCAARQEDDEWVIEGEKYFVTGLGDPRCQVMIVVAETDPEAARGRRHSQILVPTDTPGIEIVGPMEVFGHDHAPSGHMHVRFRDVRVPAENVLLGPGRGFEIAQMRLGSGRIHGCMRSLGAAETALRLMVERSRSRHAFGRRLIDLGSTSEWVARARIEIEAMRLMVLTAARAVDVLSPSEARVWVSAVKAMVPERVCQIVDRAIQVHGATGLSQWTPLADLYMAQRMFRLGDGPDEVHLMVVARAEAARYDALVPQSS